MRKYIILIQLAIICGSINAQQTDKSRAIDGSLTYSMVGEEVYNKDKEWCYTPKATTVIGMPFAPSPVQVSFDGSIYTQNAELAFFFGKEKKPLEAYQKTFMNGWIPVIEYSWNDAGIDYNIEMFGYKLTGEKDENSIQFVKITAKNISSKEGKAVITAATRASGVDHRYRENQYSENAKYEFCGNNLLKDNAVIYSFSGNPAKESIKDEPYTAPFIAKDKNVKVNTCVGLTSYALPLKKGEQTELIFKFPRTPINVSEKTLVDKLTNANYAKYKAECVNYWTKLIEGDHGYFKIPESRVENSYKAGLVHLMLATRTQDLGEKRQGSGLPYDGIFFNDFIDMRLAYDISGHNDFVELNFPWMCGSLNEEGLFVDANVSHSKEIMTSHGQALYSLCNHFRYVDDKKLAEDMFPTIVRAVGLINNDHKKNANGLVRPSLPFDAEMIEGYYTSHNTWCLLGLRSAIVYAEYLGRTSEATQWRDLEKTFSAAIIRGIEASAEADGYVPTGLYEYKKGLEIGWKEFRTNQDWENMLLVYPNETLQPDDKKVTGTLAHIRKNKYREGIMTYRDGMHLHQYATTNLTNQYIAINNQENALLDAYHILLHNGSTNEGFENFIEPWGDRDPDPIPAPHAWAAAKTSLLIRNMLIREYGGQAGINSKERSLYLFSVLSPLWVKDGEKVEICNARTEFGEVDAEIKFNKTGAEISISPSFTTSTPKNIFVAIPYYKSVEKVVSDKGEAKIENGYMKFPHDAKKIAITWKDNENASKNYSHHILKSYRTEPGIEWTNCTPEHVNINPKNKLETDCDLVVIKGAEEGFLTEPEKTISAEPLCFDLVKECYLREYARRRVQFINAGKKLDLIKAPECK